MIRSSGRRFRTAAFAAARSRTSFRGIAADAVLGASCRLTAAVAVRKVRVEALTQIDGGLRALHRMLELPGKNPLEDAHAALDAAVLGLRMAQAQPAAAGPQGYDYQTTERRQCRRVAVERNVDELAGELFR